MPGVSKKSESKPGTSKKTGGTGPIATSRLTAQGQVSVPAAVRKRFGLVPGSALDWSDENGKLVVRKAGKFTFDDIHKILFPNGPPKGPPVDVKKAIAAYIRKKHAGR
jgi:AbrB family looped-hinge helix DNA binding protein